MVQGMLKKMMEELIRDIMKGMMREMFPNNQPATQQRKAGDHNKQEAKHQRVMLASPKQGSPAQQRAHDKGPAQAETPTNPAPRPWSAVAGNGGEWH